MAQIEDTITLQRARAGALAKELGLPVNALGSAFVGAPEGPQGMAALAQQQKASTAEEPIPRDILATLAAPVLAVDLRVMFGQQSVVRSWALASGVADDAAWLLAGYDDEAGDYTLRSLANRHELLDTLATWIEGNAGLWVPEMKFTLPLTELAVLLAMADLYSRAHYSAYLTHEAVSDRLLTEHIVRGYQEATRVEDPRWLLSFALPLLPKIARELSPDDVRRAVASLVRRGLLRKDEGSEAVCFSEPGMFLAESWHQRRCLVALNVVGADQNGNIGSHAGLFIRGDEPLWYCDLGADGNAIICGADMPLTRQLLEALLTPEGVPTFDSQRQSRQSAAASAVERHCAACGKTLSAGARFCPYCGTHQEA